jgi:hypothetical protein
MWRDHRQTLAEELDEPVWAAVSVSYFALSYLVTLRDDQPDRLAGEAVGAAPPIREAVIALATAQGQELEVQEWEVPADLGAAESSEASETPGS